MAHALREPSQEYWRPPETQIERVILPLTAESICATCEAAYPVGASFCPACGAELNPQPAIKTHWSVAELLDLDIVRKRLSLSIPSLVFLILGVACITGALLTGVVYRATTILDWQAVQVWRIEWLLAAVASMLAGILLKKRDA